MKSLSDKCLTMYKNIFGFVFEKLEKKEERLCTQKWDEKENGLEKDKIDAHKRFTILLLVWISCLADVYK